LAARLLLLILLCGRVSVAGAGYRLSWVREPGAESCVSGATLTRLLDKLMDDSAATSQSPVLVEGSIAPAPPPLRWQVTMRISDANGALIGERELSSGAPRCSALTPPLLLIVAMSIDPEAAPSGLPAGVVAELERAHAEDVDGASAAKAPGAIGLATPAAARASGAAPSRASPSSAPTPRRAPERRRARAWRLLAAGTLSADVLPRVSPGVALGVEWLVVPAWSASLGLLAWPARDAVGSSGSVFDGRVSFAAAQAVLEGCHEIEAGSKFSLGLCLGGAFGERWVSDSTLGDAGHPSRAYFGALLGVHADVRVARRCFVRAGVTSLASLRRDRFTYFDSAGDMRELYVPSTVSGWALVGIGVEL
jgi:hypothetical protein